MTDGKGSRNDDAAARPALVTGGGSGIGRAVALRLAQDGHTVAVCGRSRAKLDAVAGEIAAAGGHAVAVILDVTDAVSVRAAVGRVRAAIGDPLLVVNNAGIAESRKFADITCDDWDATMAVNVTGPFLVTQACLPAMLAAGFGRVVNVGSTAAVQGFPYVAHYVASKHALLGMTRALALEVASKGVTVNCVCPGYVDTEMTARSIDAIAATTGRPAADARRSLESMSPQRRLISPTEVADAVANLCGEAARGINGQAIVINGG
ncbi:MAG: SDR family oxidoreductase [Planctomycetes bacterium]|nr:SDR family oxidoreductase [Planctomycetota bacterium]